MAISLAHGTTSYRARYKCAFEAFGYNDTAYEDGCHHVSSIRLVFLTALSAAPEKAPKPFVLAQQGRRRRMMGAAAAAAARITAGNGEGEVLELG